MSAVDIKGIEKSYGSLPILKGIDLSVESGEFIVLLGPSGCGKSTLLNIIAGLEPADAGQIMISGKDMTDADPSQRGLAMVFQSYALFPTMSVRQNLSFGLRIAGTEKSEIERRVGSVAELLQITTLLDRKPSQLSGGQRQRVAMGRALVRSTKLCLFDEPLSNLDAQLRSDMRVELRRLHSELKSTMIYVTHDQIEAMTMASRVAVMRGGMVEQYDTPQSVYDRPLTLFVAKFVGTPAINLIKGTLDRDAQFRTAGGLRFDMSEYGFKSRPDQDLEVVLGVRPDHLRLGSAGMKAPASLQGRQAFVEALGPRSLMWIDVEAQRWSMFIDVGQERSLDKELAVKFDITQASLFDIETDYRL